MQLHYNIAVLLDVLLACCSETIATDKAYITLQLDHTLHSHIYEDATASSRYTPGCVTTCMH